MTSSRSHAMAWLAAAVTVAVVIAAFVMISNPFGSAPAAAGPAGAASRTAAPRPAPTTTVNPKKAPTPPSLGSYFGAWVQPSIDTSEGRIAAVDSLQQQIGRRLDIVHTYVRWQAPFPTSSDLTFLDRGDMLLVSWAGIDTRAIVAGTYDSWIRARALAIKATHKPIFLEWRWEMDRPNLTPEIHSPALYIAAWDHIRAIFTREHVQNVTWVWCPTARGFAAGYAQSYYPGNNEVDWVCADAYPSQLMYSSFADTVQPFLNWASHLRKPVMIGEFGVPNSYASRQRAQWLRAARHTVQADPQIKALLYFDSNPSGQGPQAGYSLQGDVPALRALRAMADDSYFNPRRLRVPR